MENHFPENVRTITKLLSREVVRELYGSVDFVVISSYFEPSAWFSSRQCALVLFQ